jgi:hypothetical protein
MSDNESFDYLIGIYKTKKEGPEGPSLKSDLCRLYRLHQVSDVDSAIVNVLVGERNCTVSG